LFDYWFTLPGEFTQENKRVAPRVQHAVPDCVGLEILAARSEWMKRQTMFAHEIFKVRMGGNANLMPALPQTDPQGNIRLHIAA
jgi:hypothetical protein